MRRFTREALGQKLQQMLALSPESRPLVTIYNAADNQTLRQRKIVAAYPVPFNGQRVTVVTDGPEGVKEFTWTSERRLAQSGETPLSALEDGSL
jgi:hypothetical protein